jgi:hypothetical protein
MAYVERCVILDIVSSSRFQVVGVHMQMDSFNVVEVRCMFLILTAMSHFTSDGNHISFPLMYDTYRLV